MSQCLFVYASVDAREWVQYIFSPSFSPSLPLWHEYEDIKFAGLKCVSVLIPLSHTDHYSDLTKCCGRMIRIAWLGGISTLTGCWVSVRCLSHHLEFIAAIMYESRQRRRIENLPKRIMWCRHWGIKRPRTPRSNTVQPDHSAIGARILIRMAISPLVRVY